MLFRGGDDDEIDHTTRGEGVHRVHEHGLAGERP